MKTALLYLYTESSLHAGMGSTVSAVDLPIQRERTTDYPNVQGSGVKGALRNQCKSEVSDEIKAIFGPEGDEAKDYAGALSVGEARVVLFPVRSLKGVFAYVTCPHVLARLGRDAGAAGVVGNVNLNATLEDKDLCYTTQNSNIVIDGSIVLEEYTFRAQAYPEVDEIAQWLADNALPEGKEYNYWRRKLQDSLVILSDNAFRDFVVNSTEVVTRIKLDPQKKTVDGSALWTQEALPPDTLLVSVVTARRVRVTGKTFANLNEKPESVLRWMKNEKHFESRIQLGGDETTGQGVVATRWQGV